MSRLLAAPTSQPMTSVGLDGVADMHKRGIYDYLVIGQVIGYVVSDESRGNSLYLYVGCLAPHVLRVGNSSNGLVKRLASESAAYFDWLTVVVAEWL